MHNQDFFVQAFVYLLAAIISVPIAKRLGLGSVLGYLLAGIIIGPFVFGFIGNGGEDIMHFAEFGVVMMLFLIGLELRPTLLWKMRKSIFGLGGLQVLFSTILIAGIALVAKQTLAASIAIGLILALSSTVIVLQSFSDKGLLKGIGGQSSFSILLFQDIAVIPILAILPLLATNDILAAQSDHAHEGFVASLLGWQQVTLIILVVASIIFIGRFASRFIFRAIASSGSREIFTATALLIVVSITLAMSAVGLSPALGTFIAGVVLADNEYRHELETDIEPFKGLLLGLFFIAIGASINFKLLSEQPWLILGLLSALVIVKAVVLFALSKIFKLPSGPGFLLTFALAQGGEFAFVLLSFSLQNGVLDPAITELITIVVTLSMAITPLLLLFNEHVIQRRVNKRENSEEDTIEEKDNPIIIAGFGRFGVVVGRLLLASGFRKVTILDNDPSHIDTLRKFGFKVYYGDASRHDLLETAGIAEAKVLVIALDNFEKSTQMAAFVKRKYPHVKLSVRAKDIAHAYELRKVGAEHIKQEVSHSAIELGIATLKDLGFNPFQAHRAAKLFIYHNQHVKKDLHDLWEGDKNLYINEVKRHAAELEEILRAETEQSIHESDAAWDNTTLREEVIEMFAEMNQEEKK